MTMVPILTSIEAATAVEYPERPKSDSAVVGHRQCVWPGGRRSRSLNSGGPSSNWARNPSTLGARLKSDASDGVEEAGPSMATLREAR
jgi:hypothetical protein